ncbi:MULTISPECIES: hypothetical protein [Sinorhizobium/Ensifer group]|nr:MULTISPECIES: hypothetical protein [Sinorhizobium/Ensifer group]
MRLPSTAGDASGGSAAGLVFLVGLTFAGVVQDGKPRLLTLGRMLELPKH